MDYRKEYLRDGCLLHSNPVRVSEFELLKEVDPELSLEILDKCKEAWHRDILVRELDERERLLLLLDLSNCDNPYDVDQLVTSLHRWSHDIWNKFSYATEVYGDFSNILSFGFEACYLFLLLAKYVHPSFVSYVDRFKHDLSREERKAVEFALDSF